MNLKADGYRSVNGKMLEYAVTSEEFCFTETYYNIHVFENLIFLTLNSVVL
jgi:hypothetical protein